MSSFLTLSNSAIRHLPSGGSVGDNDYKVRLVDVPATDQANVATAVAALNSSGKGTLVLEGEGTITTKHDFTAPISLRMEGQYSLLKTTSNITSGFEWNATWNPTTATNYVCGTSVAGDDYIDSPNLSVSRGDWVVVWSDDAVSGFNPHFTNHYPMEIHRVLGQDGDNIFFDDFLWDAMSTNVKIAVVPQLKNVRVSGLKVQFTGGTQNDFTRFLLLNTCTNAVVEDLWFHPDGPGAIQFQYSGSCFCQGVTIEGAAKNDNGVYGLVAGVTNDVEFCDSTVKGTRHAFTTTYGANDGSTYTYGTQRNTRVVNVQAQTSGIWSSGAQADGTKVMFDTHPSSGNVIFQGCIATAPGIQSGIQTVNGAFQARGSGTVFQDCKVYAPSGGQSYAYRTHGDNVCIRNSSAVGGWKGIVHEAGDNLTVCGGTFEDIKAHVLEQNPGGSAGPVTIENVTAINCAYVNGTTPLIALRNGTTGHKIRLNSLSQYSNTPSIDIGNLTPTTDLELVGNVMTGYGASTCGLDADSDADGANDAYVHNNFTDGQFEPSYATIYVEEGATAQTVTADTWTKLTGFTTNATDSRNMTADATNDKITITEDGPYRISFQSSFTGSNNAGIEMKVYVGGSPTYIRMKRMINSSGDVGSAGGCGTIKCSASDDVELWVRNTATSLTPVDMQLSVSRA